tara:strand:+ start:235 stop:426 length:192 start_codon:yes stop_codon:yes gene_type:complete
MPKRNADRDLINDPVELAARLLGDQENEVIERLVPKQHMRPATRFLHDQGLTLKELRDAAPNA